MNTGDRIKRIREVERAVERLQCSGWTIERIEHVDEPGKPFRTVVELSTETGGGSAESKGVL